MRHGTHFLIFLVSEIKVIYIHIYMVGLYLYGIFERSSARFKQLALFRRETPLSFLFLIDFDKRECSIASVMLLLFLWKDN